MSESAFALNRAELDKRSAAAVGISEGDDERVPPVKVNTALASTTREEEVDRSKLPLTAAVPLKTKEDNGITFNTPDIESPPLPLPLDSLPAPKQLIKMVPLCIHISKLRYQGGGMVRVPHQW